jgi:hypothetical protein
MKTRYVLGLVGAATVVIGACSSTTTYNIAGLCDPLTVASDPLDSSKLDITGPCNLGPAGDFGLEAVVGFVPGADASVPLSIDAGFVQGGAVLYSTFSGNANIGATFVRIGGTFTFNGGTSQFSDATGSATVTDGGVDLTTLKASLLLSGSVSY